MEAKQLKRTLEAITILGELRLCSLNVTQYWQMRSSAAAVLPLQLGGEKPKVLMGRAEKFWAQFLFLQATHRKWYFGAFCYEARQ